MALTLSSAPPALATVTSALTRTLAVSGTVEVDQQGRARVLALTITSPKSDTGFVKTEVFTFSDFGGSVTVTPPPLGKTSS